MHHPEETMDTRELHQRGLKLRKRIFGDEAVEARMRALGDFGAPLQHIINAYAYGDIWSRPGLDNKIRSLVVLGMTAALNRPAEFGVHVRGALGQLRRLRPYHRAARLLGKRHRQAPARADTGAVRRLGHPPGGALHLPAEPEARGAVPEVRLLAAGFDGGDVEAGGAPAGTRAVVVLYWQSCFTQSVR